MTLLIADDGYHEHVNTEQSYEASQDVNASLKCNESNIILTMSDKKYPLEIRNSIVLHRSVSIMLTS